MSYYQPSPEMHVGGSGTPLSARGFYAQPVTVPIPLLGHAEATRTSLPPQHHVGLVPNLDSCVQSPLTGQPRVWGAATPELSADPRGGGSGVLRSERNAPLPPAGAVAADSRCRGPDSAGVWGAV